ncbi:MAG: PCRF domain-containing protein, partial [Acidobacteriota bacterium]|nr:PCRF domain-containing protein [Acidobacteriota bacterium]
MQFKDRLDQAVTRFDDLTRQLADPAVFNDADQYRKLAKARSDLAEIVSKYEEWKRASSEIEQARGMMSESDAELRQMAADEIARSEPMLASIEEELKILLLPKDPLDEKNVVLEIRAGTGGDEATLFAAEMF